MPLSGDNTSSHCSDTKFLTHPATVREVSVRPKTNHCQQNYMGPGGFLQLPKLYNFNLHFLPYRAPSKDTLNEYDSRLTFLQKMVTELSPPSDPVPRLGFDLPELGLKKNEVVLIHGLTSPDPELETGYLGKVIPEIRAAGGQGVPRVVGNDNLLATQIHQRSDQRKLMSDRAELFESSDSGMYNKRNTSLANLRLPTRSQPIGFHARCPGKCKLFYEPRH